MKKIIVLSLAAAAALGASAARVKHLQFWSESMQKNIETSVVTPDKYERDPGAEWPVVYLLHGAGGVAHGEAGSEDVLRYADQYDVIFVCPDGASTSWWLDSPVDPKMRYETYVVKELVPWIDAHYRTYGTRTQRAIMGGSMGGYGACRLGFRHKDVFGAVGNVYGGVDFWDFPNEWDIAKRLGPRDRFPERWREFAAITEAAKLKNRDIELITVVGTHDFFLKGNRAMHQLLADNKVAHTYVEIRGETDAGSRHTYDVCYKARAIILPFLANYFETGKAQIAKGAYPLAKRYTVKVTKKVWGETAAPQVVLPENWKIVEGDDGYTALDVRDYYFTIEAPTVDGREPKAPTVRLTWPGAEVSSVSGAKDVKREGDAWTFVPTGRAKLNYLTMYSDGPIENAFHHHVDGTQHGPYRNRPLPWVENRAGANWRAACWAMFRRAGFTTTESTDGAHINLYGYDTNFPYRHVDHPTHFHIMLEWGGFANNNVGHYTLNPDGSIRGNNFLVSGKVAGYPRSGYYPQKAGETTAYNGPKGNTLFTVEMLADGSGLILRKPGEKREWRCQSTHADESVILSERTDANAPWRDLSAHSVDDRPAEGRMEIIERKLPAGAESRTVIRYNRDTADFISIDPVPGASVTAAPADDLGQKAAGAEEAIPTAPEGYRRPKDWRPKAPYAKTLKEIARDHSAETMARAKAQMEKVDRVNAAGEFKATAASLDTHKCPEWFVDAKLGIFIDWGPWSVASWCPYVKGNRLYPDWYEMRCRPDYKGGCSAVAYHRKNWGADFMCDHFLDLFRGSRFNAPELMKLFRDCGAKYVIPFLKHHGGFCLWDCSYTFRDTMDMGAHRDFTREMADACRANGLKFGLYDSQAAEWEYPILQGDGSIRMLVEGKNLVPYSPDMEWKASGKVAVKDFVRDYIVPQATEFIDKYDPDIFWGDYDWLKWRRADQNGTYDIAAYMYNRAKGRKEVAVNDRYGYPTPEEEAKYSKLRQRLIGLRTIRGDFYTDEWGDTSAEIDPAKWHPWESCSGISKSYGNHWMENFDKSMVMTDREFVIHFADIVARGGNLLLLVNLDPQGAIPEVQKERLVGIGKWLRANGEAIYGSRICAPYRTDDIDYTAAKDGAASYAIVKNPAGEVTLRCAVPNGARVNELVSGRELKCVRAGAAVRVTVPKDLASAEIPFVLKIAVPAK